MTTTIEKKKPVLEKKAKKKATIKAAGFLNWELPLANGGTYKSSKGFPIFGNPEYPNPQEDKLIELARSQGGSVELTMKVRVVLNTPAEPDAIELSEFIIS